MTGTLNNSKNKMKSLPYLKFCLKSSALAPESLLVVSILLTYTIFFEKCDEVFLEIAKN